MANVSVLLTNATHIACLGLRTSQIDSMVGIWLAVNASTWSIFGSLQNLAAGGLALYTGPLPSALVPGSWHSLSLATRNQTATASVDGHVVAEVNATSLQKASGWVALATGAYGHDVLFDDFAMDAPK